MLNFVSAPHVNGIDLAAVSDAVVAIEKDKSQAQATFEVTTRWAGQTRSESIVEAFTLGGERIERQHRILADEPCELFGTDSARTGAPALGLHWRLRHALPRMR